MSVQRLLVVYLVSVFLGAALLAPWLWHAVQALAEAVPILRPLAQQPFHRYVNRCLLGLGLAGLFLLGRVSGIRSAAEIGWSNPSRRPLLLGSFVGFLAMGAVACFALVFHGRVWIPPTDLSHWLRRVSSAALSAIVVGLIEELLFRGFLFGLLRRSQGFWAAGMLSSALYAWVHFFERPPRLTEVDPTAGFVTLAQMLRGFGDLQSLVPGWFTLTIGGLILALVRERTASLWFSIGLHAGWIFWLKIYGFTTAEAPGANPWIWGTGKLFDGWVAFGLMVLQALCLYAVLKPRPCTSNNGSDTDSTPLPAP